MAKACVFDTETTSLNKPFCYDTGYTIFDTEDGHIDLERHFIIEQNWHNLPLFESAYYKEKRPLYVSLMRSKKAQMVKWGKMTQTLIRDLKQYGITDIYAYNSPFDDSVFSFNCDWFKTINPLENIAVHDIRGYANQFITNTKDYKLFCEQHKLFTETENYSATAEAVYRYITHDETFEEAHMGLHDSKIEAAILSYCLTERGAELHKDYAVEKIIPRLTFTPFTIKINGKPIYQGEYTKKYNRNNVWNFTTGD